MGVKHNYTAASGELITSGRWNADHTITGEPSMQVFTWIANPTGFARDCTSADTWFELPRTEIIIPGDLFLSYNSADTSVHWQADDTGPSTVELRIATAGAGINTIGSANQTHSGGAYYTTLDENLGIGGTWPSSNAAYTLWVRSSTAEGGENTVTLYNVTSYFRA